MLAGGGPTPSPPRELGGGASGGCACARAVEVVDVLDAGLLCTILFIEAPPCCIIPIDGEGGIIWLAGGTLILLNCC